jgi:hypothetical protein
MPGEMPRRFTVGDAMILVAAAAVGTLAIRGTLPDLSSLESQLNTAPSPGMRRFLTLQFGLSAVIPYLATLTPAVVIMRLRQPRPSLRRVGRQPGSIACTVATVAMAIEALWIASLLARGSGCINASTVFVGYAQQVSFAVVGGWVTLALSGRWRSEPGWIDRIGRILGVIWIGITALSWSRYYLT